MYLKYSGNLSCLLRISLFTGQYIAFKKKNDEKEEGGRITNIAKRKEDRTKNKEDKLFDYHLLKIHWQYATNNKSISILRIITVAHVYFLHKKKH